MDVSDDAIRPPDQVMVFPLAKRLAKFKDPRYGSATITLPANPYWESVDMYYTVPDAQDENFCMGSHCS